MGRLLGFVGPPPLAPRAFLQDFYGLGEPHYPHGWGISGFNIGRAVYFGRSPQPVHASPALYDAAVQKAEKSNTSILVAHFRKAADDTSDISRVHPFHHRDWVFAHDGSIAKPGDLSLVDTAPQGQTDSERMLHWLLERIIPADEPTPALIEGLRELRSSMDFTSLTFLLTDGMQLWAYREAKSDRTTLFWAEENGKFMVCSEPLAPTSRWNDVPQKNLIVFAPKAVPQILLV
jgi:predicted glutamine amidotransferase